MRSPHWPRAFGLASAARQLLRGVGETGRRLRAASVRRADSSPVLLGLPFLQAHEEVGHAVEAVADLGALLGQGDVLAGGVSPAGRADEARPAEDEPHDGDARRHADQPGEEPDHDRAHVRRTRGDDLQPIRPLPGGDPGVAAVAERLEVGLMVVAPVGVAATPAGLDVVDLERDDLGQLLEEVGQRLGPAPGASPLEAGAGDQEREQRLGHRR